jgi:hypothetical protein
MLDIQQRYASKYKNILLIGLASAATFLPALAPLTGPILPLLAGVVLRRAMLVTRLQNAAAILRRRLDDFNDQGQVVSRRTQIDG